MSIGKINASFLGGPTQETSLSLANLNIDFALCKVEAPPEYQGLGECLSKRRRDAAEKGNEHVFARQLGALFFHTMPSTPNLIRAYGQRASEIARSSVNSTPGISNNNKKTPTSFGVFGEWTGPDATSIWAAATSGIGAIAVHLLACMLARIWTPSEAEAIWDEIIQRRRREISNSHPSDPMHSCTELAARIEVTRDQISQWDSCARAWLEVADGCRIQQQKQLTLLVQNAGIPVNQASDTYRSVMSAWTTALTNLEKLLEGVPQSINDGSVILALTSWHMYPDMYVLGASSNLVRQKDSLFPDGAVITLGQSSRPPDADPAIYWSLPLAYLKYYGDPIIRTRSMGESTSRLTFPDFMQVILGSLIANWTSYGSNVDQACANIVSLADFLVRSGCTGHGRPRTWVELLAGSAESYLDPAGSPAQSHIRSLTQRGFRRYRHIFSETGQEWPSMFGLTQFDNMMKLITNRENKIAFLRVVAKSLQNARHDSLLIRVAVPEDGDHSFLDDYNVFLGQEEEEVKDWQPVSFFPQHKGPKRRWEYATALKKMHRAGGNRKRKLMPDTDLHGHKRWCSDIEKDHTAPSGEEYLTIDAPVLETNSRSFQWDGHASRRFRPSLARKEPQWVCILGDPEDIALFKLSTIELTGSDELEKEVIDAVFLFDWIDPDKLLDMLDHRREFLYPGPPPYLRYLRSLAAAGEAYKLMPGATIATDIFSYPLKGALWMPQAKAEASTQPEESMTDQSYLTESLIQGSTLDPRLLSNKLLPSIVKNQTAANTQDTLNCEEEQNHDPPLLSKLLPPLSDASAMKIFKPQVAPNDDLKDREEAQQELEGDKRPRRRLTTYSLSRSQIFSCIAMFENRKVNLDPHTLEQVMAISGGNSIYVTMPLLCDPFESGSVLPREIKHITGNIGRPGISLMIPPMAPKVRKVDEENWNVINHAPFDGRIDDAFAHTSLHLSFTGYQLPIMTLEHGYQGTEANFVETLVSVFDRDKWVADLDVLRSLFMPSVLRLMPQNLSCRHKRSRLKPPFLLTSLDSWDEFIDRPPNAGIVRASGNWLARLSAAALSAQQDLTTIVLEDKKMFCWECVSRLDHVVEGNGKNRLMFIW